MRRYALSFPHKLGRFGRELIGAWIVWGEHQGEGVGRDATDGGVRAEVVVFVAPVIDEEAGFGEGTEPMLVEAVVTEGAVEGFDESILGGLPGWMWLRETPAV